MNDEKLDMILSGAYSEPVYPSEELVRRTKYSIKKSDFLEHAIASCITLNVIMTFIFIYMMLFSLHNVLLKVALFTSAAIIQNAVILIICLYKQEIREVFLRLETNKI